MELNSNDSLMLTLPPHNKLDQEPLTSLRTKIWMRSIMRHLDAKSPSEAGAILDAKIAKRGIANNSVVDGYLNSGADPLNLERLLSDLYYLRRRSKKHVSLISYIVGLVDGDPATEQQLLSLFHEGPGLIYWAYYMPSFLQRFPPAIHEDSELTIDHVPGRAFFHVPTPLSRTSSGPFLDQHINHQVISRQLRPAILAFMAAFDLTLAHEQAYEARRIVSEMNVLPQNIAETHPGNALEAAIGRLDAIIKSGSLGSVYGFAPHDFAIAAKEQAFYLAINVYGIHHAGPLREEYDLITRGNHVSTAMRDFFQGYPALRDQGGYRGKPKIDRDELAKMLAAGYSKTAIARHFKCSRTAVYNAILAQSSQA